MGSKPWSMIRSLAWSVTSSFKSFSLKRCRRPCIKISMMPPRFSLVSGLKRMISSSRFKNSGRKDWRSSAMTASRADWAMVPSAWMPPSSSWLPRLEVRMMMVFLKSTVRPWESVMRPSSRICSKMLNTSGWAFSTSSKSTTLYGLRRTASVS